MLKWQKIGKIFDPAEHKLPLGCLEYAQSPQALEFEHYVRVYFSTRQKDGVSGKYLSHIAFVDFDKNLRRVIGVSKQSVIPLGDRGCFDEHGIFPINLLRKENLIIAYTCGWSRRVSVPVETAIGIAYSTDGGETFCKQGKGPILTASLHEPVLVGDPFVMYHQETFHMWYIYGLPWMPVAGPEGTARVYKIGYATSLDGINWKRSGRQIIDDRLGQYECQALPTVIEVGGGYHMYFCYREPTDFRTNKLRSYRLGYAYSRDLANWVRDDSAAGIELSAQGWDSEMMCYPHLFRCGANIHLLYNGNEFGRSGFGLATLCQ